MKPLSVTVPLLAAGKWPKCTVDGCERPRRTMTASHCDLHYQRSYRGSPLGLEPVTTRCLQCRNKLSQGRRFYCSLSCAAKYRRGTPHDKPIIVPPQLVPALVRQWRQLHDFPDYEVSNDGVVRRLTSSPNNSFKAGHIIKPRLHAKGYIKYSLSMLGGARRTSMAHQLVAVAFLPSAPSDNHILLHKNDNKLDNRVENLRWGTAAENSRDAIANGRIQLADRHSSARKPWTRPRGAAHTAAKLTEDDVREILKSPSNGVLLARKYGVDSAIIYRIRQGVIWKHITNQEYSLMLEHGASQDIRVLTKKRKRLTTKQRLALLEREKCTCHICGGQIKPGEAWDVSHEIPLASGGEDDDTNRRAAHRKCHREHTARVDIPAIAKGKRVRASHLGAKAPPVRPIPGSKASGWRKKMNGDVVPR